MTRPTTKADQVRTFMKAGEWDRALTLAASFRRLGEHATAIRRGHEAAARPEFYAQMGRDSAALRAAGIAALRERYGSDATAKESAPCDLCGAALDRPAGFITVEGGASRPICAPCGAAIDADLRKPMAERDLSHRTDLDPRTRPGSAPVNRTAQNTARRVQVALRVDCDAWARLGELAGRLPLGRAALAREAMRIGVERIEREGAAALDRGATKTGADGGAQ